MNQIHGKQRDNEPFSAISHLIGVGLSVAALVLMVIFAAMQGEPWHVVGFSVFGSSLILLYLASSLFHFWPKGHPRKQWLWRLDHAAIYVLIAGTYTPLCLTMDSRGWGWSLFGVIWGLAFLGAALKLFNWLPSRTLSTLLYVLMGWLVVIAIVPLSRWLSWEGMFWLLLGGFFYTAGAIFQIFEPRLARWKGLTAHDAFHLLVLAGSFSHFWLMLRHIVYV